MVSPTEFFVLTTSLVAKQTASGLAHKVSAQLAAGAGWIVILPNRMQYIFWMGL